MPFLQNAALSINGNLITDHNRSPLSITYNRIEDRKRMANGTLRISYIGQKAVVSCSWENAPSDNAVTADGNKGMAYLQNLYESSPATPLTIVLTYKSGTAGATTSETLTMVFSSFDLEVVQRGPTRDIVNASLELEEV